MIKINKTLLNSFFCLSFFAFSTIYCLGQNKSDGDSFWKNVQFGSGIGLGFNNGGFNGSISPNALYRVNENFSAGIGLNVNYSKFNSSKLFAYGGSILSLYNPTSFLQLSGNFEQLRVQQSSKVAASTIKTNFWSPALFLGAGYRTGNTVIGIRYNVLQETNNSIYANAWMPFIRTNF